VSTTTDGRGTADPVPVAQEALVRLTGRGPARGKGANSGSRGERSAQRQMVEATLELDQARAATDAAKKRAARAEAEAASEAKARKAAERQVCAQLSLLCELRLPWPFSDAPIHVDLHLTAGMHT
jgi:hypothetical protein